MISLDGIHQGVRRLVKQLNKVGHETCVRPAPEGFVDLYVNGERSCTFVRLFPTGKSPKKRQPWAIEADNWSTMQAMAIAELSRAFNEEVQEPFLL